ncbi:hypothetical protein THAOC_19987, partial [Thalassiosira oceanica]
PVEEQPGNQCPPQLPLQHPVLMLRFRGPSRLTPLKSSKYMDMDGAMNPLLAYTLALMHLPAFYIPIKGREAPKRTPGTPERSVHKQDDVSPVTKVPASAAMGDMDAADGFCAEIDSLLHRPADGGPEADDAADDAADADDAAKDPGPNKVAAADSAADNPSRSSRSKLKNVDWQSPARYEAGRHRRD